MGFSTLNGERAPPDENNDTSKDIKVKALEDPKGDDGKKCCEFARFGGVDKAQGYALVGFGAGSAVMSGVFLSAAFIYLASVEAGCVDENDEIDNECDNRVYGFRPAALVTNITAMAGLLAAIFMPFMGALVDYTPYRKRAGMCVAVAVVIIQGVQIGTNSNTWFIMGFFQALALTLLEIHYFLTVSYLPDIVRYDVDHDTMTKFSQGFLGFQFTGQLLYLILVVGISIVFDWDTVSTAQFGQGLGTIWIAICYYLGWQRFPHVEPKHKLSSNHHSLFLAGFRQNWKTCVRIHEQSKTLQWFLIFVCFMEAGTSAIIPVAVTYLSRVMDFNGTEIGLAFVCALIGSIPGAVFGGWLSRVTNPLNSLRLNGLTNIFVTTAGCVIMTEGNDHFGYIWGFLWGFILCWFYSSEQIFYALCLPTGQDSELSGFFVFCTIALVWLPPLLFSIVVESGIEERWGLTALVVCQVLGMLALLGIPKWSQVVEGAKRSLVLDVHDDDVVPPNNAPNTSETGKTPADEPDPDTTTKDEFQQE